MDSRLYQAAAQLPPGDSRIEQLYTLAVAPGEPRSLAQRLHMGLLLVAALLLASGLVFWVAANWQEQTRMFKLLLIEGALLVSVLASLFWRRGRIAALLCATLALGGLLAFVGQTYQTGADAWQLFATWAALALVWTLLARSDVLWLLWVLVAAAGIAMWWGHLDPWELLFRGRSTTQQHFLFAAMWLALALVPALVSLLPWARLQGGVGWWSHRLALGLALAAWTVMGLLQLLSSKGTDWGWWLSGLLIALAMLVSYQGRLRDFVSLCLCTLAANVWLLALLARLLFDGGSEEAAFLFFALATLACLAATVSGLLAVQRRLRAEAASAEDAAGGQP